MNALLMIFKLSPIFLLCALVMNGFDTLMAAPISLFYAAIVCWLTTKRKVMDIDSVAVNSYSHWTGPVPAEVCNSKRTRRSAEEKSGPKGRINAKLKMCYTAFEQPITVICLK